MKFMRLYLLTVAIVAIFGLCLSRADLLIYEGFDGYDKGDLEGQEISSHTKGLAGRFSGAGGLDYFDSGLTFSNLAVSGGCAKVSKKVFEASIDIGIASGVTVAGNLYESYLVKIPAAGFGGNIGTSIAGNLISYATANNPPRLAASYSPAKGYGASQNSLNADTTYLIITEFTNVGQGLSKSNAGAGTVWALTETQMADFVAAGFATSYLNKATIGSESNQISARFPIPEVTNGKFLFNETVRLSLVMVYTADFAMIDEIRFGTTVEDVVPVR